METLDWKESNQINDEKKIFNSYVTAWNQRENQDTQIHMHQHIEDDPFFLDTKDILSSNPLHGYEKLLNRVQRHRKCTENSCLRKKGTTLECRYKFPWNVQHE